MIVRELRVLDDPKAPKTPALSAEERRKIEAIEAAWAEELADSTPQTPPQTGGMGSVFGMFKSPVKIATQATHMVVAPVSVVAKVCLRSVTRAQ